MTEKELMQEYRDSETWLYVFLFSGVRLCGVIVSDAIDYLILDNKGSKTIAYTHAIQSITKAPERNDNQGNVDNSMWTNKTRGGRDDAWNK